MKIARYVFGLGIVILAAATIGCAGAPDIRAMSKPSESKRQFLGLKKIAILPFNNIGGIKGAEDQVVGILLSELNIKGTFEEVEDPHYVLNVLDGLKIKKIDVLDVEMVRKMGSEMNAQALVFGDIHAWGPGDGDTAAMQVSITLTLMDTQTGKPVWVGNGSHRASFTMSRAFGLNEGPTDLEVARDVIISLVKDLDKEINGRRKEELSRVKGEEDARLKAAAEAEKRRLEETIEPESGDTEEK
jgi:hypothetical protein